MNRLSIWARGVGLVPALVFLLAGLIDHRQDGDPGGAGIELPELGRLALCPKRRGSTCGEHEHHGERAKEHGTLISSLILTLWFDVAAAGRGSRRAAAM